MKIVDLKCAVIGDNPVVRIVTDEGISGYGEIESYKPYLTWHVLRLKPALNGEDPTNVERVMRKIRQRGGFKPWGSAVSAGRNGWNTSATNSRLAAHHASSRDAHHSWSMACCARSSGVSVFVRDHLPGTPVVEHDGQRHVDPEGTGHQRPIAG